MVRRNVNAVLLLHELAVADKVVGRIDIVDVPAAGRRDNDVLHRRFDQEGTARLVRGDRLLHRGLELLGAADADGLHAIGLGDVRQQGL